MASAVREPVRIQAQFKSMSTWRTPPKIAVDVNTLNGIELIKYLQVKSVYYDTLITDYIGNQEVKEIKAADNLAMANTFMLMDSTSWMVNGNGSYMGAQKVADNYGGTQAGNLACYMAGVGDLKMGNAKNAIKYLEKFDGKGSLLATIATGTLGDAYWENNQLDKALSCYEKAGADEDNFQYAPLYLQRAGMIYEKQGKTKEAIVAYTKIKEKFSNSSVARDIDKYLAKLGVVND